MSRTLVDSLKEKCRSKKELIEILKTRSPDLSWDACRKRVGRGLSQLQELGLVEKRGEKYYWYFYVDIFKDRDDYEAKLKHSRRLIPALRRIAGISYERTPEEYESQEDQRINNECAEDHLSASPETWRLLEDHRGMMAKAEQERKRLEAILTEKVKNEFEGEPVVVPSEAHRLKGFVGSNISSLICNHLTYGSPRDLKPEGEEIWMAGSLVAKGSQLLCRLKALVEREAADELNIAAAERIKKTLVDAAEPRRRLEHEIRKLILKIESWEPLAGKCEICPKVYFSQRTT